MDANTAGLQDFQSKMLGLWAQMLTGMGVVQANEQSPAALTNPLLDKVKLDNAKLVEVQKNYLAEIEELYKQGVKAASGINDRRFKSDAWKNNPTAGFTAALYLLNSKTLAALTTAVIAEDKLKARIEFATQQIIDASSPANFLAFNPEAIQQALETEGKSLAQGIQNLLRDLRDGSISQTDTNAFEVGKNVATTEGAVVYENPLFQLIEYKPLGAKVFEKPFLFIPPCINKYYILDLQPENSLIRYVVEQGHRTFVLSWRNPDEDCQQYSWDDYIEHAAIAAIHKVKEITDTEQINALGFCVGGTILSNALAVLAARKDKSVASATFLTTLLDFSHSGILDVFIDEGMVRYREQQFAKGGLLAGKDLASTFNFLRPNDLVWNYVQSNYMLGKLAPAFDLLYWNGDSTNLPGPMYAWYLRHTYLENNLIKPGKCKVAGAKIDFGKITIPVYLYASREDHIVPPQGAYASTKHLGSKKLRYVLGASGHIAGVINPPSSNKRSYWVNDHLAENYADWLQSAQELAGSWWPDWAGWLNAQAGKSIAAPKKYGNKKHQSVEPAPGRYVKAKAVMPRPASN